MSRVKEVYPTGELPLPGHGAMVIYDLSDSEAWNAALLARKAWGRRYSRVEVLDLDHIAIFMPGGARELLS